MHRQDRHLSRYRAWSEQGFLLFFDAPKVDVTQTITDLAERRVALTIITGDNEHVARHIAAAVKLPLLNMITGRQLNALSAAALWHTVAPPSPTP